MIVYRTGSFIQVILFSLLRIGYIIVAGIALAHYNENPLVTVTIAILCTSFLLITGSDEIIINSDSIRYKNGSLLKKLKPKKLFKISDIKTIIITGIYNTGDEIYTPTLANDRKLNQVKIEFNNGKIIVFKTNIYTDKLKKAVAIFEKLLKK